MVFEKDVCVMFIFCRDLFIWKLGSWFLSLGFLLRLMRCKLGMRKILFGNIFSRLYFLRISYFRDDMFENFFGIFEEMFI